ncbi:hypothetical protein ACIRD9_42615 [Streptomyces violaceus]|uniref:hypothetical protein n=1 Tax=Streptomyces violaceus TaxID=1936 RepID=UPI00381AC21A
MMKPDWRVELVAVVLYAAILLRMDQKAGLRTAASWYLYGSRKMRDVSNWAGTIAIRWENAAKELVSP